MEASHMSYVAFTKRTVPLTLALVLVLVLLVAACGAAPTQTPTPKPAVAPTATKASAAAPTTAAAAAPTATKAGAAAPTAAPPAPAAAAAAVSFAKDILPIFQKNCTRCHGGGSPRAGLSLESYQNAMKNGTDIIAGNPDKSPLYTLVKSGSMPFGGTKLADADIQKISDWIKAGAQNN
jgi:cytochrome c